MAITYAEIAKFNKVVLVYNRNSGKQFFASMMARINDVYRQLKQVLGFKAIELWEISYFDEIPQIAQNIADNKVDWVIIAGGDGTIRALIEQLANCQYLPYISVFPAGTVNLVAKELLMSGDPNKWVKRVTKGVEVPVYLGRANGHVFLTVAGIGFDSLVVDNVTEKEKKLLNKLAYVWQGTELMRKELLFSNWRYRFEVRFDDESQWHEASSVIVGKSRYYAGRYNLFRSASLSSPWLYAALFTGSKRSDFIRYAACIALEALGFDKDIVIRKVKKLEIRCNVEHFAAELDGDAVTAAPLEIVMEEVPVKFLA